MQKVALNWFRMAAGSLAFLAILFIYAVARQANIAKAAGVELSQFGFFIVQHLLLFLAYQSLTIVIIWAIFHKRKYVQFVTALFAILLITIVPIYCWLDYSGVGGQTTWMIAMRQLFFNPALLLLLLPALFYQKMSRQE